MDFRATPDGRVPEAWKNLPPPQIVRPEPEKPKEGIEGLKKSASEFLRTRAAKQAMIALGVIVLIALVVYLYTPPATLKSHHGALRLFCEAMEDRDLEAMQETTTGMATQMCQGMLRAVTSMEEAHQASRFTNARPIAGGASSGAQAANAYVICEGENGDDFLRIDMVLRRQEDGTWRIAEMATRPM